MTVPPTNNQGYSGQMGLTDDKSDFNVYAFIIEQMLGLVRTATLVEVVAVDGIGPDSPVGFVDAHPLVNQIDGVGKPTPHGNVLNLPYFRLQGGGNAVVIDPQVGDIGIAIISDRDISAVKAGKAQANPGSFRRFDLADGIYLGGILNGTPDQYVALTADGITLSDKNGNVIAMKAGSIDVTTTAFRVNGQVIGGFGTPDQVNLQTHVHPTAASGPPSSPTPGT